jgi:YesN/AraC family two-component response regulator
MPLRTLIVDDEELARQWLRRRLEDFPDVEIV